MRLEVRFINPLLDAERKQSEYKFLTSFIDCELLGTSSILIFASSAFSPGMNFGSMPLLNYLDAVFFVVVVIVIYFETESHAFQGCPELAV